MGARQRINNLFKGKASNSAPMSLPQQFLRYGNRGNSKMSVQDLLDAQVSDQDLYTGYNYAAIRKRANRTAQVAVGGSIRTEGSDSAQSEAKSQDEELQHPYLAVIDESTTFSNTRFWTEISTYLDLEGVYYLMVVRNFNGSRIGAAQEFKLLNPYNVTKVLKQGSLEVGGYRETRNGFQRDIPPQMIIEIRELNPFDQDQPYSLIDAGKENSQTRRQAGRYTRSSLSNNLKSPGIISSEVQLSDDDFQNFKARVMGRADGEPIFGNGTGAVKWDSMDTDLDKAALDKINAMSVEETLAVTGLSKTMLGIEVSGVTRDTSETQSELFVTSEIMPRIQLIIDALNQDYKNNYPVSFQASGYRMVLDSPLGADREAELKDIEVRDESYQLYVTLVNEGYSRDIAARYANGEIGLDELEEPTEEPKKPLEPTPTRVSVDETPDAAEKPDEAPPAGSGAKNALKQVKNSPMPVASGCTRCRCCGGYGEHDTGRECYRCDASGSVTPKEDEQPVPCDGTLPDEASYNRQDAAAPDEPSPEDSSKNDRTLLPVVRNAVDLPTQSQLNTQEAALRNAITAIEAQVVGAVLNHVTKNAYDATTDLLPASDQQDYQRQLEMALSVFYAVVVPLYASAVLNRRTAEFTLFAQFTLDAAVKQEIARASSAAAASHIQTIMADVLKTVQQEALAGTSQQELITAIRREYADISKNRATVIARSETNRAFTMAQFEADKQFLAQNDLTSKAYKQWIVRSDNPCPFCQELAAKGPIPFEKNFADLGDTLSATETKPDGTSVVRKMPVNYEALEAGNAHPNCSCIYQLIVEGA